MPAIARNAPIVFVAEAQGKQKLELSPKGPSINQS